MDPVSCILHPVSIFILPCNMTRKERYRHVIEYFLKHAPDAETELDYDDPYELLVAVILSAQCTDKRVNMTTPAITRISNLFQKPHWKNYSH